MAKKRTEAKTQPVATWATPDQFERYAVAAGAKPMAEWVRETLDHAVAREPFETAVLRRLDDQARRLDLIERIVLNVAADLSSGVTISRDRIRQYRESLQ